MDRLTTAQQQAMLQTEFGGMNEVLASLYGVTAIPSTCGWRGSSTTRPCSIRWPRRGRARRPARQHADPEDHRRRARVRGDGRHALSRHRDVLLGSRGAASLVRQRRPQRRRDLLSRRSSSRRHLGGESSETCNTYNMLKLTRHLFEWARRPRHGLLRARPLQPHPGLAGPRHRRRHLLLPAQARRVEVLLEPATASFWCCVGTGLENHAKYADTIYFHDDGALFVNLFIPAS